MILQITLYEVEKVPINFQFVYHFYHADMLHFAICFCLYQLVWLRNFSSLDIDFSNWFEYWTRLAYLEWIPLEVYNSSISLISFTFFLRFCIYEYIGQFMSNIGQFSWNYSSGFGLGSILSYFWNRLWKIHIFYKCLIQCRSEITWAFFIMKGH